MYNYTVYANETETNFTMELEGNFAVVPINLYVCSDENLCYYNNFTEALFAANNTNNTITLLDSNRIYSIPKHLKFNIAPPSPVFSINASGITLQCNGTEFTGNGTGDGVIIWGYDNITITGCNFTNYSTGIFVDDIQWSNITLNTIRNSTSVDMNMTSSVANTQVWSNNFYGRDVLNTGQSNKFCYNGDPALDNLQTMILALDFQENGGNTTYDNSGYGNDGVLYPSISSGPQRVAGKFYNSLNFDGLDDYVNVSIDESLSTNNISVGFWMYLRSWNSANYDGFLMRTSSDSWNDGFGFSDNNDNTLRFWVNNYNLNYADSAFTLSGGWHYIVGTYDHSNIKLYIDGVLRDTTAYSGDIQHSTKPLFIGSGTTGIGQPGYFSNSTIDSVVIYNRSLRDPEIFFLYQRGKGTGNFYNELSNRTNIEYNLDDCGISQFTYPPRYGNFTGTITLGWTSQTVNTGVITYYLTYTNNSGLNWYDLGSTSSTAYPFSVSSLVDGDGYMINIRPFDGSINGTNATSELFGVHNSLPNITLISQTDSEGLPVDSSNPTRGGEIVSITVNVSDFYGVDTVWINIWNTTIGSTVVWRGLFDMVSGNLYNGIWSIDMIINESFPEIGIVNYSINANGSLDNSRSIYGNFSILDNELLCSNLSLCEYSDFNSWLIGEDNTNNTLVLSNSSYIYRGGGGSTYHISPMAARAAFEVNSSNITLDCQGSTILGGYSGTGLFSNNFDNLNISNCKFGRYSTGINISNTQNSNLSEVSSFSNSGFGAWFSNLNNSSIFSLNSSNNGLDSIRLMNSQSTNLVDSIASYSSRVGLNITNSSNCAITSLEAERDLYGAVYLDSRSNYINISDSTFTNSSYSSLMSLYADYTQISGNKFYQSPPGYYGISIARVALTNRIWLNSFFAGGILNNGTDTILCVSTPTYLQNGIYSTSPVYVTFGNYYSTSINSSFTPVGSCGNLSIPYGDFDGDGYNSLLYDCDDVNKYTFPYAFDYCDEFDNDCDGVIDEEGCAAEPFPSAGAATKSGGSGGVAIAGYSPSGSITEQDIKSNSTVLLYRGESVSFIISGKDEVLMLKKVYFDKVNLSISSLGKDFVFYLNESALFDLDNDGSNDLSITLSSIIDTAAVLELVDVSIPKPPEVTSPPEQEVIEGLKPSAEKPPSEQKPSVIIETGKGLLKYIIPAISIIILITLISAGAASYIRFMGNVSKAEDYVQDALERGFTISKIRRKLIEAGWEPQVVDSILKIEYKDISGKQSQNIKEEAPIDSDKDGLTESLVEKEGEKSDTGKVLK
ncbi:MAG: hypothetical protein KKE20_03715 [Nanoarchaeota archaeon]|nr:hypothetical protein [Nanoarchaeota archaeon]